MSRRIVYCITCNAKYDVSGVIPGSRFICKTCETTIRVPDLGDGFSDPLSESGPAQLEVMPEDLILGGGQPADGFRGLSFTKLVGTGNDFLLVDCMREGLEEPGEAARMLCDRRFGAGADGLLLLLPTEKATVRMRMFNPDGSEAEACGNGLRCLVKYAFDHGHVKSPDLEVETAAGVRRAEIRAVDGVVGSVRVGMGRPLTKPAEIPVQAEGDQALSVTVEAAGRPVTGTAVSMGNPHFVVFVPDVDAVEVETLGPALETHPIFPRRTNVEFVQVCSSTAVRQRTWERGAGETLACGSGACAACVAGSLLGKTERRVTVSLRGGELDVDWTDLGEVFLEGPAQELFTGLWCSS